MVGLAVTVVVISGSVVVVRLANRGERATETETPSPATSPATSSPTSAPSDCPTAAPLEPVSLPSGWGYRIDTVGEYAIAIPSGDVRRIGGTSHRIIIQDRGDMVVTVDWFSVPGSRALDFYLASYADQLVESLPAGSLEIEQHVVTDTALPSRDVRYHNDQTDFAFRISIVPGRLYVLGVSTNRDVTASHEDEILAFFDSLTPFVGCPAPSTAGS